MLILASPITCFISGSGSDCSALGLLASGSREGNDHALLSIDYITCKSAMAVLKISYNEHYFMTLKRAVVID